MASSQSFSMIQRRISLSPEPGCAGEQGRAIEDDGQPRAAFFGVLHLADHVLKKKEGAVIDARQPRAEPPAEALFFVLPLDEIGFRLPLHAERRIGQHIVELVARKVVIGETVAEGDVLDVLALDHHVRPADGIGLGIVVLAEDFQAGVGVKLADIIFGDGQHAAGSAGRVIKSLHDALGGENVAVRHEKEIHHQTDDLTRGEVIAGLLVRRLVEAPDKLLEDIAHLDVRDDVRMQIDIAELGYDADRADQPCPASRCVPQIRSAR